MDAKLRYKAKKIKIVFFDIDDTLRNSKTGFIPTTIPTVFKQLREKGILTGIASGRGIFGVVPEIRDLKPDFFVTLNGAYIEDKKGQVIYQHQIGKSDVEEYISWAKQEGIEYGLVGSHDAKLSTRTDMMSEAINPIYPDLDVDPDFHEKEISIRCGLLKIREMTCTCLTVSQTNFAWFVGINIRLILCLFQAPKRRGWKRLWNTLA